MPTMSIEVTGHSRPGKPTLAIVVSALLLILTLAGATAVSYVRNRPVALTPVQDVPAVPGLKMAWPKNWTSVQLPSHRGPVVKGFTRGAAREPSDGALFLLAMRVSDSYVPPQYAAPHLLHAATQQLGLTPVVNAIAAGPAELMGRPAFQMACSVYSRQRLFWALLRVACEPNGQAMGLLLLSEEPISPATRRVLNQVSDSMQFSRRTSDVAAALALLKLNARPADASLSHLRGYVEEMPAAGPIGITFVPEGPGIGRDYAINVWTSWLANRRTLQDMANTWFRRMYLEAESPNDSGWVQRSGSRIWRMTVSDADNGRNKLIDALYLRELPDRRVVWARTIADPGADPEGTVLDLLSCILGSGKPDWGYDSAVSAAASVLAALATDPITAYYRANMGPQEFVFTGMDGRADGTGRYTLAIKADGTLVRTEEISIGPNGETLKSQKTCLLRADLSAFQVKDTTLKGQEGSLKIDCGRNDAASPVGVRMQFGGAAAVEASFVTREAFLPDPAMDPAACYIARRAGTTALFRTVGMAPEVPESVLLTGLGQQRVQVAGRQIDAFACVVQDDTSGGPTLAIFDGHDRLIGYLLAGGASFLRTMDGAEDEPAEEAD
jgi:hypothetical protein